MNIGTLNVRSIFQSEAVKLLHNELSKLHFDVVALQETRLESGTQKFGNYTLLYNGSESEKN